MSITASRWAWRQQIGGNSKLVLLVLADHANEHGRHAFPSVAHIAYKTYTSERTVQRALRILEEAGLISKTEEATRHRATVYALNLSRRCNEPSPKQHDEASGDEARQRRQVVPAGVTALSAGATASAPGVPDCLPGVTARVPAVSPEPSLKPSGKRTSLPPVARAREQPPRGREEGPDPTHDLAEVCDQVERILREVESLTVTRSGVEHAIRACPKKDPVLAAREVAVWATGGELRNHNAGALLLSALRKQHDAPSRSHPTPTPSGRSRKTDLSRFERVPVEVESMRTRGSG